MDEIEEITKQRNEVLKRIQERQRLMELIQNKNLKNTINPLELFKKTQSVKKIQNAFRMYREVKRVQKEIEIQKENAKYKFNSSLQNLNLDLVLSIIKIQRKFRNYMLKINHEKTKNYYLNKFRQEAYKAIPVERVVELRKEVLKRLKTMVMPDPAEYEKIVNTYFNMYKEFCVSFPERETVREENVLLYYQNYEMIKFMDSLKGQIDNDKLKLFNQFMLNKNKEYQMKKRLDAMEKAYSSKSWWSEYAMIDDFEENNLLDEIDNRYNFKKRNDIVNYNLK